MKSRCCVYLLFLCFLLYGCSGIHSAFLDDTNCELPCWRSITIGETTKEQVKRSLEQMTDIKEDSVKESPAFDERYDQFIYWDFKGVIEAKGEIDFQQNIAKGLSFQYDPGIPLKKWLSRF